MTAFAYDAAPVPIRDDLPATFRRAWERLARPGTWWTGRERVAIAAEIGNAPACALCMGHGDMTIVTAGVHPAVC